MELLYNAILLPDEWPPRDVDLERMEPEPVPYLEHPPETAAVGIGRELFVDDFLIERTTLRRVLHHPEKYAGNPVLFPETPLETNGGRGPSVACPKSGGIWYEPEHRRYRLWYEAGWCGRVAVADSGDGLRWERPELDIFPGTNRVSPYGIGCDSWGVVRDECADPGERYKIFVQEPCGDARAMCFVSPDGIHWGMPVSTGYAGDRSTMFYNPFRRKWCFSLRSGFGWGPGVEGTRCRSYAEGSDFFAAAQWGDTRPGRERRAVNWAHADALDPAHPETGRKPQLYNLDAVAYESLMLGMFEIHHGPSNEECMKRNLPKITELVFAYSRDGFHWHRPDRTPAIRAERGDVWDCGYIQPVGNLCTAGRDRLTFYFTGFQGARGLDVPDGMYHRGATGVAFLRRDGFASMEADEPGGELLTRKLKFKGEFLFVNLDSPAGELRAEVLDESGGVIAPWSMENCLPVSGDGTALPVRWNHRRSLAELAGRPVRLRFSLVRGKFYSFWITPDPGGCSYGYLDGGGREYHSLRDVPRGRRNPENKK